jgi:hypothetical protein
VSNAEGAGCTLCDVGSSAVNGKCAPCSAGMETDASGTCVPCKSCGAGTVSVGCGSYLRERRSFAGRHPRDFTSGQQCVFCPAGKYKGERTANGTPWSGGCQECPAGQIAEYYRTCMFCGAPSAHCIPIHDGRQVEHGPGCDAQPFMIGTSPNKVSCNPCCKSESSAKCGFTPAYGSNGPGCYGTMETVAMQATCKPGHFKTMSFRPPHTAGYVCTICPAGTTGTGTTRCTACPANTMSNAERTECISSGCPAGQGNCGTYGEGYMLCEAGCRTCPAGQFSSIVDRGTASDGTRSFVFPTFWQKNTEERWWNGVEGTFKSKAIRLDAPSRITLGKVFDERKYLECKPCPNGKFQQKAGQNSCSMCSTGRTTSTRRRRAHSFPTECLACPTGQVSQASVVVADSSPATCGTYCKAGQYLAPGSAGCAMCPKGKFTEHGGEWTASSPTSCASCPAGKFTPFWGDCSNDPTAKNERCSNGRALNWNGNSGCEACPAGQYTDAEGTYGTCKLCPSGQVTNVQDASGKLDPWAGGATACASCPSGRGAVLRLGYRSQPPFSTGEDRAAQLSFLNTCGGKHTNGWALAADRTCPATGSGMPAWFSLCTAQTCPVGSYAGHVADFDKYQFSFPHWAGCTAETCGVTCSACAANTFSAGGNVADVAKCHNCPLGTFSLQGAWNSVTGTVDSSGMGACTQCPAGKFASPSMVGCDACPAGRATARAGMLALADCTACAAGRYNAARYNHALAKEVNECVACPAGAWTPAPGKPCLSCEHGKFLGAPNACVRCPVGKYQIGNEYGVECKQCKQGSAASGGASGCYACPSGRFGNSKVCKDCGIEAHTAAAGSHSCVTCALGKYSARSYCATCPGGRFITPKRACQRCPGGTYQERAIASQFHCKNCPFGQYSSADRRSCYESLSFGNGCKPGEFRSGFSSCDECPDGKYTSGFHEAKCEACPAGRYTSYEQGTRNRCYECKAPWVVVDGGSRCVAPGAKPAPNPTCPCNERVTTAAPTFNWSQRNSWLSSNSP